MVLRSCSGYRDHQAVHGRKRPQSPSSTLSMLHYIPVASSFSQKALHAQRCADGSSVTARVSKRPCSRFILGDTTMTPKQARTCFLFPLSCLFEPVKCHHQESILHNTAIITDYNMNKQFITNLYPPPLISAFYLRGMGKEIDLRLNPSHYSIILRQWVSCCYIVHLSDLQNKDVLFQCDFLESSFRKNIFFWLSRHFLIEIMITIICSVEMVTILYIHYLISLTEKLWV